MTQSSRGDDRVRALNHDFRRAGPLHGRSAFDGLWLLADEILAETPAFQWQVLSRVQGIYPGPHDDVSDLEDHGATEVAGRRVTWQIEYVDRGTPVGAHDPADNTATCRIITIMADDEI